MMCFQKGAIVDRLLRESGRPGEWSDILAEFSRGGWKGLDKW